MSPAVERPNRWITVVIVLFFLGFISFISSIIIGFFLSDTSGIATEGNVAHISIQGPIMATSDDGIFASDITESEEIVKFIEEADKNPEIKAILIEINSPGGSAVASAEIAEALLKTNKTTVAWIREAGASGAYWIASSTDHIVAHPLSITGSIGVIASYLDFAQFINRYNVTYQRLVAGKYKDMGTPFRHLTDEEEDIFQQSLDSMHDYFIEAVANNRGLDEEEVRKAATGQFYIGKDAKEIGLVDELGGKAEAIAYIEKTENITATLAKYEKPKTLAELLTEMTARQSFFIGEGIASGLAKQQIREEVSLRT
jgi:protease-4